MTGVAMAALVGPRHQVTTWVLDGFSNMSSPEPGCCEARPALTILRRWPYLTDACPLRPAFSISTRHLGTEMKARALSLLVLCALALAVSPAVGQQDVQYQRRGNRSEGIKPKPVSGYDVELLSALVDTQEDMSRLGPTLGFRFFL
jgi:hypothetical protein